MNDTDRIKKTIRDLLNLANNDAAFDQESENALRFARKLMNRHGLDQADLEEERDADSIEAAADVEYGRKHCFSEAATLSWWERTLASTICDLIGTLEWYYSAKHRRMTQHGTVAFKNGKPQTATKVTFYGPQGDCADAIDLFDEWRQIIIAMARLKHGGVFRGKGRSYCEGFAAALWEKFRKIRKEEEKAIEGPRNSNALMLINSGAIMKAKKERAADWLKNTAGVKLKSANTTSYRKHHGDAYRDGKADGANADLSASRRKRLT